MHLCHCMLVVRGQPFGNWFFLSTLLVPGLELRFSDLAASISIHQTISSVPNPYSKHITLMAEAKFIYSANTLSPHHGLRKIACLLPSQRRSSRAQS